MVVAIFLNCKNYFGFYLFLLFSQKFCNSGQISEETINNYFKDLIENVNYIFSIEFVLLTIKDGNFLQLVIFYNGYIIFTLEEYTIIFCI